MVCIVILVWEIGQLKACYEDQYDLPEFLILIFSHVLIMFLLLFLEQREEMLKKQKEDRARLAAFRQDVRMVFSCKAEGFFIFVWVLVKY